MFQKQSSIAAATVFDPKTVDCRKRLFLIEDDKTLAEMYKTELKSEGFLVEVFPNGKDGLKAICGRKPDLVLLDILLPEKDGFDVLREVNKRSFSEIKDIPIIILSNLSSSFDKEEAIKLGAKDWWAKTDSTPQEITQKVKEFLSGNHIAPNK